MPNRVVFVEAAPPPPPPLVLVASGPTGATFGVRPVVLPGTPVPLRPGPPLGRPITVRSGT